jgi:hypothetical protein
MITLHLLLMILAVFCLALAACDVKMPFNLRGNFLGAGLCLWALSTLITV